MLKKKNSSSAIKNNFNNTFFDFSKIGVVSRNICKQGKQLRGWNFFPKKKKDRGPLFGTIEWNFLRKQQLIAYFFKKN